MFDGINIFGIVKETGVDDEGLVEFHNKYFRFPLFCDKSYAFYRALGDRKVGLKDIWNPLSIIGIICEAIQRIRDKSISGNMLGEGIVQGGFIIFDRDGAPKCMYQEATGVDLPVRDLAGALNAIQDGPITS